MKDEDITRDGQADASQLNAAAPDGAVGGVAAAQSDNLSLSELNKLTGKNFPTREAALKSITDTFSYVGKRKEDIASEVKAELGASQATDKLARELEEMRKERFFDKNPQYADPAARKLIERIGGRPEDVVASEEFKTIFDKARGYDETQKLKTVLGSNPRLASSRDSLGKAKEMSASGQRGEALDSLVARAVNEAYGE